MLPQNLYRTFVFFDIWYHIPPMFTDFTQLISSQFFKITYKFYYYFTTITRGVFDTWKNLHISTKYNYKLIKVSKNKDEASPYTNYVVILLKFTYHSRKEKSPFTFVMTLVYYILGPKPRKSLGGAPPITTTLTYMYSTTTYTTYTLIVNIHSVVVYSSLQFYTVVPYCRWTYGN